jgi:folate-dependent phosphoribosylglycinamide formyltransferase PurN
MLTSPRVAVLCSKRAPGLAHLLDEKGLRTAMVVCCITSETEFTDAALVTSHRLPLIAHSLEEFRAAHAPDCRLGDRQLRIAYDCHTVRLLADYQPDVVVLAGYLLMLTRPMLTAYAGRIVSVHHSDLLLRDAAGGPRYPGLRAVRDAILAGEPETRSCAHLVTERLDEGPVLARSRAFPVPDVVEWARGTGQRDVLKSAIWAHQEWMLRDAFGPLMVEAIGMVGDGSRASVLERAS